MSSRDVVVVDAQAHDGMTIEQVHEQCSPDTFASLVGDHRHAKFGHIGGDKAVRRIVRHESPTERSPDWGHAVIGNNRIITFLASKVGQVVGDRRIVEDRSRWWRLSVCDMDGLVQHFPQKGFVTGMPLPKGQTHPVIIEREGTIRRQPCKPRCARSPISCQRTASDSRVHRVI